MPRLLLLTLGVTTAGVLALAAPAAAHVTVNPSEATQGKYARLAFRVPTESDTASTTKVEVTFPTDAGLKSVSTMPVPGWTATTERSDNTVSKITWTADANAVIKPGQFQEFPVSVGPLPTNTDRLIFKALQTYSDGTVVRWIEDPGATEPEHPAPVLTLAKAAAATTPTEAAAAPVASTSTTEGSNTGVWLGALGLIAGLAGLALGTLAFLRTRQLRTPAA
nr:YcnI family protein [Micromonospora sp. NBRC 107566]